MSLSKVTQKLAQALALTAALAAPVHADEPKQEQKPQLTDKQKEELEAHTYKLKDGLLSNGSISNLDPANASVDDSSDYYKAFLDIRDFLGAYDRETIPDEYRQWHDRCIDALLRNIFVPNHTILRTGFRETGVITKGLNDQIRETLQKEGVLDYGKQLEHLVDRGRDALKEAGRIATLSKPEEYKQTKEKVEALHDYVTVLQQLSDATIGRALEERLRPIVHSPGEIDDARIEIIKTAREAYDHLSELQEAIDTKDVTRVKTELKEWRSKLKNALDDSQELAKKTEEETIFELERPYEWKVLVVRKEHRTSEEMVATKAFAEEWGKNGEHFYSKLDKLRGFEEGFVGLEKYMAEKIAKSPQASTSPPKADPAKILTTEIFPGEKYKPFLTLPPDEIGAYINKMRLPEEKILVRYQGLLSKIMREVEGEGRTTVAAGPIDAGDLSTFLGIPDKLEFAVVFYQHDRRSNEKYNTTVGFALCFDERIASEDLVNRAYMILARRWGKPSNVPVVQHRRQSAYKWESLQFLGKITDVAIASDRRRFAEGTLVYTVAFQHDNPEDEFAPALKDLIVKHQRLPTQQEIDTLDLKDPHGHLVYVKMREDEFTTHSRHGIEKDYHYRVFSRGVDGIIGTKDDQEMYAGKITVFTHR